MRPRLYADLLGFLRAACTHASHSGRELPVLPFYVKEHAVGWLCRQPSVAEGRLGVIGVSKGAELALLCTTYFPEHFGAAVAYAPSAVAFAGISSGGEGWRRSSWSAES